MRASYLRKAWTAEQLASESIIVKEESDLRKRKRKENEPASATKILFKFKWPPAAEKLLKENLGAADYEHKAETNASQPTHNYTSHNLTLNEAHTHRTPLAVLDQDVALPSIEQPNTDESSS